MPLQKSVYQFTRRQNKRLIHAEKIYITSGGSNAFQQIACDLEKIENIVGKGENAGYQHFLLFPTMFSTRGP